MTRYIQKLSFGSGRGRWVGWEIDGIGSEIPGLVLADGLTDQELAEKRVKNFIQMSFDEFVKLGVSLSPPTNEPLHDQDLAYRMDALQVALDRFRRVGEQVVPRKVLQEFFGDTQDLADTRIQRRFFEWERQGAVEVLGLEECYIRIVSGFGV